MINFTYLMLIDFLLFLMYVFFNKTFFVKDFSFNIYTVSLNLSQTAEIIRLGTLILNLIKLPIKEFHPFELENLFENIKSRKIIFYPIADSQK
jgi:hypothetical protein